VCDALHIALPKLDIFRAREAVPLDGELAMIARKPTILRWSEEAEASHVREWVALERRAPIAAARPTISSSRPPYSARPTGVLFRLRSLLRRATAQITQDG